jgi:hypothetical protein
MRCCSRATLNWIGVIGAFLVMAVVVALLKRYTTTPAVDTARARERLGILAENRQTASTELDTAAWIDKEKGVVRLPNRVAVALALEHWKNPAQARAALLERADKAFFMPPPPPEAPSEFE